MLKTFASFAFVSAGICAFAEGATAEDKLFKNYVYQTPLASYTEAAGYYDCFEGFGGNAMYRRCQLFGGEVHRSAGLLG